MLRRLEYEKHIEHTGSPPPIERERERERERESERERACVCVCMFVVSIKGLHGMTLLITSGCYFKHILGIDVLSAVSSDSTSQAQKILFLRKQLMVKIIMSPAEITSS
jgi:hypothetical protein